MMDFKNLVMGYRIIDILLAGDIPLSVRGEGRVEFRSPWR
jgi:hypothetical protein